LGQPTAFDKTSVPLSISSEYGRLELPLQWRCRISDIHEWPTSVSSKLPYLRAVARGKMFGFIIPNSMENSDWSVTIANNESGIQNLHYEENYVAE
jgi:hypothetical protein